MQLYRVDPLSDPRWEDLVASHSASSVFHQTGWIRALARTYGYRPFGMTSAPPGERILDGVIFCEVRSWITGRRLVSLPFTDHVEPLLSKCSSFDVHEWIEAECRQRKWAYVELRPRSEEMHVGRPFAKSQSFWLHTLDLTPSNATLFSNLHKSCVQRRIRHAEHQQLSYERGHNEELLGEFYKLLMLTRRRFGLLPQPRAWFKNLLECMGPQAEIRLVRKAGSPVAALLTLRHRETVVYKYGCSDPALHHLGGIPFLFWRLIEESRAEDMHEIDFGRTDRDNEGLARFKDRLGTVRRDLNYFRDSKKQKMSFRRLSDLSATRFVFSVLPNVLSSKAGGLVYRHIG